MAEVPALLFKNFSFRYKTQSEPTLINIDLKVAQGEKLLILGPSGCGKSTLIHCINGIIPHAFDGESSGELFLTGKNINNFDIFGISKIAGTVLQDTDGQFVGLSSAEDIAFALENDCVSVDEMHKRVAQTALLVNMEKHLDKSPHDLSGGQKQRISMAGILVDDVDILLFDEPLANLDPASGKDAVELIDELHKKTGKTILIVEHRLEDVLHRSVDRIIVLDKGRIVADMEPARLLASNLLKEYGIRQPLYLTALSYAGIKIEASMSPDNLDTMDIDYNRVTEWYRNELAGVRARSSETDKKQPGLLVQNLTFSYGEESVPALDNITFTLSQGECVGLAGRNGAGKSTLAKCICGFTAPDSGTIFYNGNDLSKLSIMERAENIGYVMQNPNQMISFPMIFEEVAFGLRNRGILENEIKSRVFEALEICGLLPFRNWPCNALSYGQKKRLTIASILVLRPSLVILDEPTAGQDYRHYTEFMEFLLDLNQNMNISLLLITHDMHLMLEYTTRAIILSDGYCVANQEPFEVLTDDNIISKANLKRTSLYSLALKGNLSDPRDFVSKYISFDRRKREQAKN